jgi:predicted naringenin-chalcone synthase
MRTLGKWRGIYFGMVPPPLLICPNLIMMRRNAVGPCMDRAGVLADDTLGLMSWTVGDTGSEWDYRFQVPGAIAQHLPHYLISYSIKDTPRNKLILIFGLYIGGRLILDKFRHYLN